MTTAEGIIGLVASVVAIIGALVICSRYLARRFDHWADALIENSKAVKDLTVRVVRLEGAIKSNGQSLYVRCY